MNTVQTAQIPVPTAGPGGPPRQLLAIDGPMTGRAFPLDAGTEIGREAGPIPLAFDTSVSRRHVRFAVTPQGIEIQDLGSTNGTFVNGQKITTATIRQGDVVKSGVTNFRAE